MSVDLEDKPGAVYDDDKPAWKTNLHDDDLEKSFEAPSATDEDLPDKHPSKEDKDLTTSELREKEEKLDKSSSELSDEQDKLGAGYTGGSKSSGGNVKSKIYAKRKQIAVGGGIAGLIGVGGVSLFLMMIPLKVLSVSNNLQERFFGSSESAVEGRVEHLFNSYLVNRVLPSLNGKGVCKSTKTIDRSCIQPSYGKGQVKVLYDAWADNRLETKMADKYGFEIARLNAPDVEGRYILKVNGQVSDINVDYFKKNPENGLFQARGNRNDMRRAIKEALAGETRWKKVMYRFKVGRLMERKYGIRRCVFYCKTSDKFTDWKENKKGAFKSMLARRVLEPRSQTLGIAMECIFSTSCDNEKATTDGNEEGDYEKKDKVQRSVDKFLADRGVEFGSDTYKSITKVIDGITESGGFGKFVTKAVIEKIFGTTIAKFTEKALPIIGWIDMAANIITKVKSAGPKFKKWAFAVNSAGMVSQYMLYASHAHEIKNGNVDIGLMGSVATSLNGMEKSPLYKDIMETNNSSTTSNILMPSVNAQSTDPEYTGYTCDDGKPVPAGEKICKEESLQFDNALTTASSLFNEPPLEQFGQLADLYNSSIGKGVNFFGNLVGDLIQALPGIDALNSKLAELIQPLQDRLARIIPNPFSDNQSGGRSFNLAAGGADVSGNHNAEFGLGGKRLTNQEVSEIRTNRKNEQLQNFKEKPLYARLFDSEDSHSLISQIALKLPGTSTDYAKSGFASLTSNPISKIFSTFGNFFRSNRALADTAEDDPFGIPQYGYPLDDPSFTAESPDDCAAYNKAWAEDTTTDDVSGQEIHSRVNLCLLDEAAVGSAGGYFTTSVLTSRDLGEANAPAPAAPTNPTDTTTPTGNGKWTLAPGANKPGRDLTPLFTSFLNELSKYTSFEPIVTTGTNHSQFTTSGNVSDHYAGNGADFGSVINKFGTSNAQSGQIVPRGDEIAAAGMIACGVDQATAKAQAIKGGVYNMNCKVNGQSVRVQVLWKTDTGGNHHNHVHVGIKAL